MLNTTQKDRRIVALFGEPTDYTIDDAGIVRNRVGNVIQPHTYDNDLEFVKLFHDGGVYDIPLCTVLSAEVSCEHE